MLRKPKECRGCPLYGNGRGFVPALGTAVHGVAICGMAPASSEVEVGRPFQGMAGKTQKKILWKGGFEQEEFLTFNLIQCRPPGDHLNSPEARQAIHHCKVHRDAYIQRDKPTCIVALGADPLYHLTGESGILSKMGYAYPSLDYGVPVVGTVHPQYINYEKKFYLIAAVLFSLKVKPGMLEQGETEARTGELGPAEFSTWVSRARKAEWVVVDIETPYSPGKAEDAEELEDDPSSTILRMSFASSLDPHEGITVPYGLAYKEEIDRLLRAPVAKVFWNYVFDVPRLEFNNHEVNGRIIDAMWLWHFLQPDLPRGLGHVAPYFTNLPEWKSRAEASPEYYSAMDAVATALIYLGVQNALQERGMWEMADRHVTDLLQVLRKMGQRGIHVDRAALQEFREFLQRELAIIQANLNSSVPLHIRRLHPPSGYVRPPASTEGLEQVELTVDLKVNCPTCDNKKKGGKESCTTCQGKGKVTLLDQQVTRWAKRLDFSAMSGDQLKDYMVSQGHPVPFSRKMQRETTEKKFLVNYRSKYPDAVYGNVLDYRRMDKLRSTYAGWNVADDGLVHTILTLAPATGRLSSRRPNMQNIPTEGELAERFRACLVAPPGFLLLRRDYVGIEALLTGYFAGDEEYMFLAALGVHAWVTARKLGMTLSTTQPDLAEVLAKVKHDPANKPLYKKCKTCNHGINYCLGPDSMFEMNPGVFINKGEARRMRREILEMFPKIAAWQDRTIEEAKLKVVVENPFGYIRWLWDIPGMDGPKAVAQRPQSTAAAIIKEAMLRLDETPTGECLVLQVHDELVLRVPQRGWKKHDRVLQEIMEAPIPQLGGLVIRTELKLGRSLREEDYAGKGERAVYPAPKATLRQKTRRRLHNLPRNL